MVDTWRAEAFNPNTNRQEQVVRVRSTTPLRATFDNTAFQAVVEFADGEHITIVTTALNLSHMKGMAS